MTNLLGAETPKSVAQPGGSANVRADPNVSACGSKRFNLKEGHRSRRPTRSRWDIITYVNSARVVVHYVIRRLQTRGFP
jgi:hypothetical protein